MRAALRVGALGCVLGGFLGVAGAAELTEQALAIGDQRQTVQLPVGYRLEILNDHLDAPRLLTWAPDGALFIGSKRGLVYRLVAPYDSAERFAELPGYPHSVAFRDGEILIARTDGIYRAPWSRGQTRLDPRRVARLAALPDSGGHNSRTVSVGPDGRVYASLGISGNCADEYLDQSYPFGRRRGGVLVLDEQREPASWEVYAAGLRNPVGLAWDPVTRVLYASNNGPDHLGFDQPPEYFSRLEPGSFHGMPWFQFDGRELRRDPCIASSPPLEVAKISVPVATFPARSAPLGVAFIPPYTLPRDLEGDVVVALHGSWATAPSGGLSGDPASRRPPKLVHVRFRNGHATGKVEDLVTGFQLPDGRRWARPVGVAFGPDGALYFTSDSGLEGLFRLRRE